MVGGVYGFEERVGGRTGWAEDAGKVSCRHVHLNLFANVFGNWAVEDFLCAVEVIRRDEELGIASVEGLLRHSDDVVDVRLLEQFGAEHELVFGDTVAGYYPSEPQDIPSVVAK